LKPVSPHTSFVSAAPAIFVFLWSTGYVGARFGLPYAEPFTFTSIRFAIVGAIMGLLFLIRRSPLPRDLRLWGHLAVSGVLIHTCFVGGVFSAIHLGVDISIAALIAGAQPLLTAIVVVVLFSEVLSRRQWTGFVLGFVGLSMVILKTLQTGALPWAGLIGCMIGLCGLTFGTLYQKRYVVGVDLLAGSAIQFMFALIPCITWALCFESTAVEWNITFILALTWLCVALSIGAISVLLFLIREGAAARVSSLFYLVPPVTALQGYWFFGERLSLIQLIGIGVTAAGVAMINFDHAKPAQR
jgi:drug/metabolite transporter (DMT)-like permease